MKSSEIKELSTKELVERLEYDYLPVFPSSERAIKALSALYRYKHFCMEKNPDTFSARKSDGDLTKMK